MCRGFRDHYLEFQARGAEVIAVSGDYPFALYAWGKAERLPFPLVSDYGGVLSQAYGIWKRDEQFAQRSVFLIDRSGVIRYCRDELTPERLDGTVQALVSALDSLKTL